MSNNKFKEYTRFFEHVFEQLESNNALNEEDSLKGFFDYLFRKHFLSKSKIINDCFKIFAAQVQISYSNWYHYVLREHESETSLYDEQDKTMECSSNNDTVEIVGDKYYILLNEDEEFYLDRNLDLYFMSNLPNKQKLTECILTNDKVDISKIKMNRIPGADLTNHLTNPFDCAYGSDNGLYWWAQSHEKIYVNMKLRAFTTKAPTKIKVFVSKTGISCKSSRSQIIFLNKFQDTINNCKYYLRDGILKLVANKSVKSFWTKCFVTDTNTVHIKYETFNMRPTKQKPIYINESDSDLEEIEEVGGGGGEVEELEELELEEVEEEVHEFKEGEEEED